MLPKEEREEFGAALPVAASEANSQRRQENWERRTYLRRCLKHKKLFFLAHRVIQAGINVAVTVQTEGKVALLYSRGYQYS